MHNIELFTWTCEREPELAWWLHSALVLCVCRGPATADGSLLDETRPSFSTAGGAREIPGAMGGSRCWWGRWSEVTRCAFDHKVNLNRETGWRRESDIALFLYAHQSITAAGASYFIALYGRKYNQCKKQWFHYFEFNCELVSDQWVIILGCIQHLILEVYQWCINWSAVQRSIQSNVQTSVCTS